MITFFALAFGLTWAVWVPRALHSRGVLDAPRAVELGAVWNWIPAVAALLTAALTAGRAGLREWAARLVRLRIGWRWYLLLWTPVAAPAGTVGQLAIVLVATWLLVAVLVAAGLTPHSRIPTSADEQRS